MDTPDDKPTTDVVFDLFERASALSPDERTAFLDAECTGNASIRAEVESLLDADDRAGQFLADPTVQSRRAQQIDPPGEHEELPRRIGVYKLLQVIGQGGFGTVYLAEQQEPVRRKVALKIIKLGMDTKQVIARFDAERQAVAIMDHPNIAKVFDAGATDTGRPYFVMELVNGVPITQYCDENRMTARQRLELLVPVCHAVQHAHQKGVIHRDIKPNNVLITLHDGKPVPKVIDFGIAKATGPRLTDQTLYTELRTMVGTPEYMSPEQAEMSGLDVDTRSDVYGLGVLMYELLTGSTPIDAKELRAKAFAEMQRVIREVDPPRPSTRLSSIKALASVAAQRGVEPQKLHALIRGDLDWIVMKCLEKDRTRRYASASALAEDVENYLGDQPVNATPPSPGYRFRKFLRRHKLGMAVAATVLLALSAGLVIALIGFNRARKDRDIAVAARNAEADARAYEHETDRFLIDMFATLDPSQSHGKEITVRSVLEDASKRIDANPPTHPLAEASLRTTFGIAFLHLGQLDQAGHELERSLTLERKFRGNVDIAVSHVLSELGQVYLDRGEFERSEGAFREAYEVLLKLNGRDDAETMVGLTNLANILIDCNKLDEADPMLSEVLQYDRTHAVDAMSLMITENGLADLRARRGKHADAESLLREATKLMVDNVGPENTDTLIMQNNLAEVLRSTGKLKEAADMGAKILPVAQRVMGIDHLTTLRFENNQALRLCSLGRLDESEALFADTVARMTRTLGAENARTLTVRSNAIQLLWAKNRLEDALIESRDVAARLQKAAGADNPNTLTAENQIAWTLAKLRRFKDAEPLMRDQLARARKILGEKSSGVATISLRLGFVLIEQGKLVEAEPLLRTAYDNAKSMGVLEVQPQIILNYALCLSRQKRAQEALPMLLAAEHTLASSPEPDAALGEQRAIDGLIETYQQLGNSADAQAWRARRPPASQPASAPSQR